jgi:TRAP-type C4-dicarboxylate transport system permease small subunit
VKQDGRLFLVLLSKADPLKNAVERFLESIVGVLMVSMFVVVVMGVVYRKAGHSLVWYDEVASIMLAWLTYYGAALAALKRAHIGVPGVVEAMPLGLRKASFIIAEAVVFGFFILLAWVGWQVLQVLKYDFLISLPEVSTQYTQSVIPLGAALFVFAQALSLPEAWRRIVAGKIRHDELDA